MYNSILTLALSAALLTALLCLMQILKRIRKPAAPVAPLPNAAEFSRYLKHVSIVAFILFAGAIGGAYYLDRLRHGAPDARVIYIGVGGFLTFLMTALLTERLHQRMNKRVDQLRKDSMSRLFRHFLYAGALLGMGAVFFAACYVFLVQKQATVSTEFFLLPAYAGALLIYWLRFNVSLIARSSDYAFELMGRQEAVIPLLGDSNPLWRLRIDFAGVNRFLFYHLEFFVLCIAVLLVSGQIETQTRLAVQGRTSVSLTVFSIGVISAIPAFFIMRVREKTSPETFLWNIRIGYIAAISIQAIVTYMALVVIAQMHIKYFWVVLMGSLTAFMLNVYSAAYVAENHKTARSLIAAAASSVSTVIHRGIAAGMRGSAIPALIIAIMMGLVYLTGVVEERGEDKFSAGLFALSLALTSMISLFTVAQATAVIMPLASTTIARLRALAGKEEKNELIRKFRDLRSVAMPSYVLHGKVMFSALAILIFLVYAQILSDSGHASLFKHLTQTAMLLLGGIASYFLSARINELVLNLGPLLVREASRQFRELSGLSGGQAPPDLKSLWRIANDYLTRKILPLFIGTMLLPAIACLLGGAHGLAGYLIGFGFLSFLNGNSWLTTGAAWSSARHAAEADKQVTRHTAQLEALVQADIVGDSMHEAVAPTLSGALLATIIASLLFTPATLELHEILREFVKKIL